MEIYGRLLYSLIGAVAGCAATIIIGFSLGGWMTDRGAERATVSAVREEVIKVLVPHCIDQALHDPNFSKILAQIKDAPGHNGTKILIQAGWATLLPMTDPDLSIAAACTDALLSDHRY
ncbi:MAG: hypothetical protein NWR87_04310 [Rhodospirillales bacterium]|nr:hypothetical protein [Rhodospirillales bacterium]